MNLNELSRTIDKLASHPSTPVHFSSSIEKLMELFATVLELKGEPGWYQEVNKRLESDFTEEEAATMQPLISLLTGTVQTGGVDTSDLRDKLKADKAALTEKTPEELNTNAKELAAKVQRNVQTVGSKVPWFTDDKTKKDIVETAAKKAAAVSEGIQTIPLHLTNEQLQGYSPDIRNKYAKEDKEKAIELEKSRPFSSNNMARGKAALKPVAYKKPPVVKAEGRKDPKYMESYILNGINDFMHKISNTVGFNYDKTDTSETSDFKLGANIVNTLKVAAPLFVTPMLTAEEAVLSVDENAIAPLTSLSKVVVPYRAGVAVTHTFIDLLRFGSINSPFWRQLLSIVVGIIEILKGDWKSAALSIAGVYSENAAYAGIIAKLVLNIFLLMDEEYQIHVLHGITAVPKSILVGIILFCFQTFATFETRKKTNEILADLLTKVEEQLTKNISSSEFSEELLTARKDGLRVLSFGTLNLLQKLMHRKEMVCTSGFQSVLANEQIEKNVFLRIFFTLMEIPFTEEDVKRMCGTPEPQTWAKGLFQRQIPCDPIKKSVATTATSATVASAPAFASAPASASTSAPAPASTSAPPPAPDASASKSRSSEKSMIKGLNPPIFTNPSDNTRITLQLNTNETLDLSVGNTIKFISYPDTIGISESMPVKIQAKIESFIPAGNTSEVTAPRWVKDSEQRPVLQKEQLSGISIVKGIKCSIISGGEKLDAKYKPTFTIGLGAFKYDDGYLNYNTNSIELVNSSMEGGLRRSRRRKLTSS